VKNLEKGQHLEGVGIKEEILKINIKEIWIEGVDWIQVT